MKQIDIMDPENIQFIQQFSSMIYEHNFKEMTPDEFYKEYEQIEELIGTYFDFFEIPDKKEGFMPYIKASIIEFFDN